MVGCGVMIEGDSGGWLRGGGWVELTCELELELGLRLAILNSFLSYFFLLSLHFTQKGYHRVLKILVQFETFGQTRGSNKN